MKPKPEKPAKEATKKKATPPARKVPVKSVSLMELRAMARECAVESGDEATLKAIELTEREKKIARREALLAIREAELSEREKVVEIKLRSRGKDMDNVYDMMGFVRRAPTLWHLDSFVDAIIQTLVNKTWGNEEEKEDAYRVLGLIARRFRLRKAYRQDKLPPWLTKALKQPAFIETFKGKPPPETRGGMGGNESMFVVQRFTEHAMITFDKSGWAECVLGGDPKARYANPIEYLKHFKSYAKDDWENGGRKRAQQATGYKLTPNSGPLSRVRHSFSDFESQIIERAEEVLKKWLEAYPQRKTVKKRQE